MQRPRRHPGPPGAEPRSTQPEWAPTPRAADVERPETKKAKQGQVPDEGRENAGDNNKKEKWERGVAYQPPKPV